MHSILLLACLSAFAACKPGNQRSAALAAPSVAIAAIGDTVHATGKNLDCIFQDRQGVYWFGSNGEGAYRYDGHTLTHITDKQGLCSNFVWSIGEDPQGRLWFSTREGYCCLAGSTFTNYTYTVKTAPYAAFTYRPGGLFFGNDRSMCFYDGTSFTNFLLHPDMYMPASADMNRPYSVYSTLADRAGRVWFGTQEMGVARYADQSFTYLTGKNLAGPAVRALFEDRNGLLWFGNNGGGLYRYDGSTLTNITEEKGLGNPDFLNHQGSDKPGTLARVWAINEDKEGNLWVGTIDAGLWKINATGMKNYSTQNGLPGNAIWKMYKDRQGELWFIVNGESIHKIKGETFTTLVFQ